MERNLGRGYRGNNRIGAGYMDQTIIFLTIMGMFLVTYLPRILPLLVLPKRQFSAEIRIWLKLVPVAVLSALLFPSLIIIEGQVSLRFDNLFLWAAVPTIYIAWRTRSLFMSLLVGMSIVALARFFIPL